MYFILACIHAYDIIHVYKCKMILYPMKVVSAGGLDGAGDELAVEAVFVSSTSIIFHFPGNQQKKKKKTLLPQRNSTYFSLKN